MPDSCDPMDYSPPGTSIHGIFRVRVLSGLPFSPHEIFPTQGSNLGLLHCRQILYPEPAGKPGHVRTVVFRTDNQQVISQQVSGCNLLYSTWNSAQLLRGRLDVRGVWGRMDTHVHICIWLSLFAAYLKQLEHC